MLTRRERGMVVDALRSGQFEQTRGALSRTDDEGNTGYCCVGVGCLVFNIPFNDTKEAATLEGRNSEAYDKMHQKFDLPEGVSVKTMLDDDYVGLDRLVHWNDSGKTFEYIAQRLQLTPTIEDLDESGNIVRTEDR